MGSGLGFRVGLGLLVGTRVGHQGRGLGSGVTFVVSSRREAGND
jgi:hypothetical protein